MSKNEQRVSAMRSRSKGLRSSAPKNRQAPRRRLSSDDARSQEPAQTRANKVPVTLEFEKAGKVKLSLDVQALARGPPGADKSGGHMDMKKTPDHSGMKM